MRIRDWSSDVCSSDLCKIRHTRKPRPRQRKNLVRDTQQRRSARLGNGLGGSGADVAQDQFGAASGQVVRERLEALRADRKSVVQGKSVSIRVEPGGGRTINKKNITEHS